MNSEYIYKTKQWLRQLDIEILKKEIDEIRIKRGLDKFDWENVIELNPKTVKK